MFCNVCCVLYGCVSARCVTCFVTCVVCCRGAYRRGAGEALLGVRLHGPGRVQQRGARAGRRPGQLGGRHQDHPQQRDDVSDSRRRAASRNTFYTPHIADTRPTHSRNTSYTQQKHVLHTAETRPTHSRNTSYTQQKHVLHTTQSRNTSYTQSRNMSYTPHRAETRPTHHTEQKHILHTTQSRNMSYTLHRVETRPTHHTE